MRVILASDHVGLGLKHTIMARFAGANLGSTGLELADLGTHTKARIDYPPIAWRTSALVTSGQAERAILICGSGVGMAIAANKVPGIRAVVCSEPYSAAASRRHNNSNVLALGSRVVGPDLAVLIVQAWLQADFCGGRHSHRLTQISQIENHYQTPS